MNSGDGPHELEERPQSRREWSGWLRSVVLPIGILVAIIGGLLWYQSRGSTGEDSGFGTVPLPAGMDTSNVGAEKGKTAPDFVLQTLEGQTLRLSDLRGRPVLVNFWASWCIPCREETPLLEQAYDANKAKGLQIVAVNLQEADPVARSFVDEWLIPYPVVMDRQGQVARNWHVGGGSQGLPMSFFIDANGMVQKVVLGQVRQQELNEGLKLILGSN
jgi:cytochrome c biogenesis protein CcmG/thiol:disulfide interchange protein DsbE